MIVIFFRLTHVFAIVVPGNQFISAIPVKIVIAPDDENHFFVNQWSILPLKMRANQHWFTKKNCFRTNQSILLGIAFHVTLEVKQDVNILGTHFDTRKYSPLSYKEMGTTSWALEGRLKSKQNRVIRAAKSACCNRTWCYFCLFFTLLDDRR